MPFEPQMTLFLLASHYAVQPAASVMLCCPLVWSDHSSPHANATRIRLNNFNHCSLKQTGEFYAPLKFFLQFFFTLADSSPSFFSTKYFSERNCFDTP